MNIKHLPIWANKSEGDYPSFTGENLRVSLWFRLPKVTRRRLQTINEKFWRFSFTTRVEKVATFWSLTLTIVDT